MKRSPSSDSSEHEAEIPSRPARPLPPLTTLSAPVSPPRKRTSIHQPAPEEPDIVAPGIPRTEKLPTSPERRQSRTAPTPAATEACESEVSEVALAVSEKLSKSIRPEDTTPRISLSDWVDLYSRNEQPEGRHFVVHQHDHPLSGPHYDLRLQFSQTSSVCWSIMYGLPGDPNSIRVNRNATETRIHSLNYHLEESASSHNGSQIIWDTGEYEILPYRRPKALPETDDSRSNDSEDDSDLLSGRIPDSAKLREAFQNHKIRLRLHGTRLPKGYTVQLVLDKSTNAARPAHHGPKRRKRVPQQRRAPSPAPSTSDSNPECLEKPEKSTSQTPAIDADHSDNNIDLAIRRDNAYPGSSNSIGSIHQRRWWLSLDRENSGFAPKRGTGGNSGVKKTWVRREEDGKLLGFPPFYVRGPDDERSIVTGRLGRDVVSDENVKGFVSRKGWKPVTK